MRQLKSRTLDVVITKITAKTVTYELAANGQLEEWRIPPGSTFDTSVLQIGTRYTVQSKPITCMVWNYKAQQYVQTERFDWTEVRERPAKARLGSLTAKQSKTSKELESMQIVGEGDLFQF